MNILNSKISNAFLLLAFSVCLAGCKKDEPKIQTMLIDIESNSYNLITIGTQIWMKENLKTTKYNDGTSIPLVTDATTWINLSTPGYCWYNNDEANYKATYGALYNWHTINTGKLCPQGWHVPTDAEWHTLVLYLDAVASLSNTESLIAGGKLKESGTAHWNSSNTSATNETGFTALPGGSRYFDGSFLGPYGVWWSATESDPSFFAWNRSLFSGSSKIIRNYDVKWLGFSVRCVMNY